MATRKPVAAANWKMVKTGAQARAFAEAFKQDLPGLSGAECVICPPYTALHAVQAVLGGAGVGIGGQDLYWEPDGAFTGQINAGMLVEAGCTHVIVGHSERRKLFGETDETVNKKLVAALAANLTPILCVGETLGDRDAGRTEQVVWAQLTRGLEGHAPEAIMKMIIAYEPVWAIGTGRTATPAQAQEVHAFIRAFLAKRGPGVDAAVRVLYGGSVKPDNTAALMAGPDVDGALVGGAALDPASFAAIARAAAQARPR